MASNVSFIPWASELHALACRYGERNAIDDGVERLSYADLYGRALALADLVESLGLSAPQRIGVLLRNSAASVVADYAVSICGACIVHLNAAYSEDDLAWCMEIAPFDVVLTEPALVETARTLGVPVLLATQVPQDGDAQAWRSREVRPSVPGNREARIIFTSGSSGRPKAVVYSHQKRWNAATVLRSVLPYRPDAQGGIALMTPYVHGASSLARAYLDCGSRVVLMQGIEVERLRACLSRAEVDAIFAPPSVMRRLCDVFAREQFTGLRCVFTGTEPLNKSVYERAAAIFGPCIRVTYGKTENLNPITVLDPDETDAVYAMEGSHEGVCVGYPGPGVEIRFAGNGEILIRTQHGFDGYLAQDGCHPNGPADWHATGDIGALDADGRLWLKGRASDVINTGGYMVDPGDIEARLMMADKTVELCVFGLPSDYWTEVVACGYCAGDAGFDPQEKFRPVLDSLSKYKQPRIFVAVESIPRTPLGKVNRRALRQQILDDYALIDGPYPRLVPR